MATIKVYYDKEGKTLTVWFDDPQKEHIAEETSEEIILIKDINGSVIGFERLNYDVASPEQLDVETMCA